MTASLDLLDILFEKEQTLVTRRVAGEVILVPINQRMGEEAALYTLDEVAAFLWEKLDGRHTGRDLIQTLEATYTVKHEQAEQDVQVFLERLKKIEAIRPVTTSTVRR